MRRLQRIKTWQLLLLLLLMGFIAATFLRLNNIGMVQRRDAVLSADKNADTNITQTRMYDLQRYVASHMNADMGTIYLEGQYGRDSQKLIDTASNKTDGYENGKPFREAQAVCAPRYANLGHYSQAYQQCVISELDSHGESGKLVDKINLPKADEYRHSYASPLWSPDFAGFSVLICVFIILMIIARITGVVILRIILKMQHRTV